MLQENACKIPFIIVIIDAMVIARNFIDDEEY